MLHHSISTLRGTIRESWVESHQDDHQEYDSLSLAARLNVDADALARQYIIDHPDPVPFVYQFPIHGATLETIQGTITGQYKTAIRDAATWPQLQAYLCKRFEWDSNIVDRIDWTAMGSALSAHRKHQTTLVKHLIRQAPTGHIAYRNDPRKDPSCFCCKDNNNQIVEDNNHVLGCPGTRACNWRKEYLQDIHRSLNRYNLHSDPTLLDILRDGMQRWLEDTGTLPALAQYAPKYHRLIDEQNLIGWDQPLRGRLSLHWNHLQQEYITAHHITDNKVSGQSWSRAAAQHGISWWLKRWKSRNDHRFGDTIDTKKSRIRAQIHRELSLVYDTKQAMQAEDRYIFLASADAHMALYPDDNLNLQNWINTNEPAIRRSIQLRTQALAGG